MRYIFYGLIAFGAAILFDLVSLKRVSYGKQAVEFFVVAVMIYSIAMLWRQGEKFASSFPTGLIGWPIFLIFASLFVYSVFIEVPFRATYVEPGHGEKLITTGTWALVRHPGVLWFTGGLFSLALISHSKMLLLAAPIWSFADVLYVSIQDKFFFQKFFRDYARYQRCTPMLVPTRESLKRCIQTFMAAEDKEEVPDRVRRWG